MLKRKPKLAKCSKQKKQAFRYPEYKKLHFKMWLMLDAVMERKLHNRSEREDFKIGTLLSKKADRFVVHSVVMGLRCRKLVQNSVEKQKPVLGMA